MPIAPLWLAFLLLYKLHQGSVLDDDDLYCNGAWKWHKGIPAEESPRKNQAWSIKAQED